jgi:hypothetical protein
MFITTNNLYRRKTMNIHTTKYVLAADPLSDHTETRLSLSTSYFRFLAVHVLDGEVVAVFEEEKFGRSANRSFFVHKIGGDKRFRQDIEPLAGFVLNGEIYHVFGSSCSS